MEQQGLPPHDPETGEILDAPPADPLADLLMLISEAQTVDELEQHRGAVAGLKNGQKARAVAAWKAKKAELAGIVDAPAPAQ